MPHNSQAGWKTHHDRGFRCQLAGEWEEARACYQQALELNPDLSPARLALAKLAMMQSGFHEGRELYEARFDTRQDEGGFDWRLLPLPRWRGENIAGKHLHLWVEQGFGDVIMYAGFLPWLLAQQPSRITLSMFPKMMTLFARSFPQLSVEPLQEIGRLASAPTVMDLFPRLLKIAGNAALPVDLEPMRRDYERALARPKPDIIAPMGDLMVYGLPGFVPARRQAAYLKVDAGRVAEMKKRLAPLGAGRLVGVSWHTANQESGHVRCVPLAQWLPILHLPGCHFISLQHHVMPSETEGFCRDNNCRIIDPGIDPVQDTEGLAALTACMEEVITVDNSNVHLAGALGVPTTLLLPKGCDFRWPLLENPEETLWYASVRIERQEVPMDWQPVIKRVSEALRRRVLP